jgi:hypothetical protein
MKEEKKLKNEELKQIEANKPEKLRMERNKDIP